MPDQQTPTTDAPASDQPPCSGEEQLKLAKAAISHALDAIAYDPRKYWLLGNGTGTWEKLTTAAAALWNVPVETIRKDFRPDAEKYSDYCERLKADERLLDYCREKGITIPEDYD